MEEKLELRLYGLVPYNISPIQQGIQYGHAKDEYTLRVIDFIMSGDKSSETVTKYIDWLRNWKTYIILNGGTTNNNPETLGTLNQHLQTLKDNDIFCTPFYEPDIGDQLTGVDFIVDERVFNRKKYPDFDLKSFYGDLKLSKTLSEIFEDPFDPKFPNLYNIIDYRGVTSHLLKSVSDSDGRTFFHITGDIIRLEWDKWVESIGGKKNLFLRLFLDPKNFKLA